MTTQKTFDFSSIIPLLEINRLDLSDRAKDFLIAILELASDKTHLPASIEQIAKFMRVSPATAKRGMEECRSAGAAVGKKMGGRILTWTILWQELMEIPKSSTPSQLKLFSNRVRAQETPPTNFELVDSPANKPASPRFWTKWVSAILTWVTSFRDLGHQGQPKIMTEVTPNFDLGQAESGKDLTEVTAAHGYGFMSELNDSQKISLLEKRASELSKRALNMPTNILMNPAGWCLELERLKRLRLFEGIPEADVKWLAMMASIRNGMKLEGKAKIKNGGAYYGRIIRNGRWIIFHNEQLLIEARLCLEAFRKRRSLIAAGGGRHEDSAAGIRSPSP